MKVFISWSGARSRAVAEALSDWLKQVIQAIKPFYSPDIEKGVKWSGEIDNALEGTKFGIVCLTPDNLNSTWIHYETGALSKTKDAKIWTFLHGLNYSQVPQPLGKFQHTLAEKDDVFKLLKSINSGLSEVGGEPLAEQFLEKMFNLLWESLEERLKAAESLHPVESDGTAVIEQKRDNSDVLNEILEIVRDQQRQINELRLGTETISIKEQLKRRENLHNPNLNIEFSVYVKVGQSPDEMKDEITAFLLF
ncbi:MAG TPA: toll/interleukin-1 receptor domain-containing protein [Pyrinomonadaceae bacterium]|jgi:hypothetical protein